MTEESRYFTLMPGGWYKACNAIVADQVTIGEGSSIWFGCVLRGDIAPITIGRDTNVQDLVCIHVDPDRPNVIGDRVSFGHSAVVHGDRVGDDTLIGMGAILLGGSVIGEGCIIGAGAVVTENAQIPPRSVVLGVPGRIVREVTEAEVEHNRWRAQTYRANAARWTENDRGSAPGS